MKLKNLPQGWVPGIEAIKRIVWRKHPGRGAKERDVAEEAWRELCGHAFEGRIRAVILTESGAVLEADRAQFIALQERYIFNAGTQGYWLENEHRYAELELKPENKFLDKHGRSVRGQLLFSESDIETSGAQSLEKPSFDEFCSPVKNPIPAESTQNKVAALVAFAPAESSLDERAASQVRASFTDDEITDFLRSSGLTNGDVAWPLVKTKFGVKQAHFRSLWKRGLFGGRPGRPVNSVGNSVKI